MTKMQSFGKREDHPLLQKERCESSVRPHAMACLIYGGKENLDRYLYIHRMIQCDPVMNKSDRMHLNHKERYIRSCEKMARFKLLIRKLGLTVEERDIAYDAMDEVTPIDVHMRLSLTALKYGTSREQRERWLPPAMNFDVIVAYCQTELGHGSNVRGIETTATFDGNTREWILHSPTLTSIKWWPGGLGKTATHAIIMATVVVKGKNHGVAPFFVQLRDVKTHTLLPGVTAGDMGPKLGYNSMDNGFLRFNAMRVAEDRLLNGVARVSKNGNFEPVPGVNKMSYFPMLKLRVNLVFHASRALARAVTIAIRYSAVRLQGFTERNCLNSELQILDYPTQQCGLIPQLAYAFGLHFVGKDFQRTLERYTREPDPSFLSNIHASSSGMKALVTTSVADGIEAVRKLCGGQGFLQSSGLPEIFTTYLPVATLEGTQEVMEPQMARYLLKVLLGLRRGRKPMFSDLKYLVRFCPNGGSFGPSPTLRLRLPLSPESQIVAFEMRAALAVRELATAVSSAGHHGISACGIEAGRASRSHCQLLILRKFSGYVSLLECGTPEEPLRVPLSKPEISTLRDLCSCYALWTIENNMGDFIEAGAIDVGMEGPSTVRAELQKLCSRLRKECVSLVDSFHFTDEYLDSTIGRYDGYVYDALYEAALEEPMNASDVVPEAFPFIKKTIVVSPVARL